MTRLTPSERTVVFPEPLHTAHRNRRVALALVVSMAVASLGWMLLLDPARDTARQPEHGSPREPAVQGRSPVRLDRPALSPVDSGVDAFADAEYDAAAATLRRALGARGGDSLDAVQRVRALTFLGAAELELGNRDSSAAAFRRLLVANPNRPPDPAIFGRPVVEFYDNVRSQQQGVARIASTPDGVALTIVALSPHQVSIGIAQSGRQPLFQLFTGAVRDSVVVTWNGLTPERASLAPGPYEIVLVAFPSDKSKPRRVRFPVLLERESTTGQLHARAPGTPAPAERSGGDAGHFLP